MDGRIYNPENLEIREREEYAEMGAEELEAALEEIVDLTYGALREWRRTLKEETIPDNRGLSEDEVEYVQELGQFIAYAGEELDKTHGLYTSLLIDSDADININLIDHANNLSAHLLDVGRFEEFYNPENNTFYETPGEGDFTLVSGGPPDSREKLEDGAYDGAWRNYGPSGLCSVALE